MSAKEIKAEIRAVRAEMKERGIKTVSCFNGGLDDGTYRANARLFQLSVQLSDAIKAESQHVKQTLLNAVDDWENGIRYDHK